MYSTVILRERFYALTLALAMTMAFVSPHLARRWKYTGSY